MRQLGRNDPAPSPYKPTVSPLRSLSSIGSNPLCIHPDPAHTYAIHGWGKDLAAGALLCLIHLRHFWDRTLERSLNLAYEHFRDFCQATGKSTSIVRFDLKELKTDQASHGCRFTFYKCCMVWILVIVACTYLSRLKISKWPGQGPRLCCGAGLARGRHFKHKGKRSGFLSVLMHYGVLWEVVHSYIGS